MGTLDSFVFIGFIVMVYNACKDVWKTYFEKKVITKIFLIILVVTGGFILGSIVSGIFFLLLSRYKEYPPNIEAFGSLMFLFIAFCALLIAEILKFYFARKKDGKQSKEYKEARKSLILSLVIPFLILAVIFLVMVGVNTYKESSCKEPNTWVIDKCCIQNTDLGFPLCEEDAQQLNSNIDKAIRDGIVSTGDEEIVGKIILKTPPGYYLVKNNYQGSYGIPLYLLGIAEDKETPLIIASIYFEDETTSSIYEFYNYFNEGYFKAIEKNSFNSKSTEPVFYTNDYNTDVAIFNTTTTYNGETIKSGIALLLKNSNHLMLTFQTKEPYFTDNFNQFESMVNTVQFRKE